jgi:uncharacterized protein YceK
MRKLVILAVAVMLSGCASIQSLIPSFSDPNQSARIVDVRYHVERLNCAQPHLPQALLIEQDVLWFQLYSESKGHRQQDVLKLIAPLQLTVTDFVKRSQEQQGTEAYCGIKKKIMQTQSRRAAEAVLGRF